MACDTVTRAQIADIAEKVFPMSGGGPVDINATGLVAVPYNQILFDVDKVAEEFISNERLRLPWRLPPQQLKARVVAWLLAGVLGGPLVEGKDAVRYGNRIFERLKTVQNKVKAICKRERELVRQAKLTAKSDGTEEFVLELTVGFLAEDAQREVAELMNNDPYSVPELCATARTAAAAAACTTLVAAPAAAPAPTPAAAPAAVSVSAAAAIIPHAVRRRLGLPLCAELERLHDHGLQLADVHEMDDDAWWTATRAAVEILVRERDGLARRLADANTHNETEFVAASARSEQVGRDISDSCEMERLLKRNWMEAMAERDVAVVEREAAEEESRALRRWISEDSGATDEDIDIELAARQQLWDQPGLAGAVYTAPDLPGMP